MSKKVAKSSATNSSGRSAAAPPGFDPILVLAPPPGRSRNNNGASVVVAAPVSARSSMVTFSDAVEERSVCVCVGVCIDRERDHSRCFTSSSCATTRPLAVSL